MFRFAGRRAAGVGGIAVPAGGAVHPGGAVVAQYWWRSGRFGHLRARTAVLHLSPGVLLLLLSRRSEVSLCAASESYV